MMRKRGRLQQEMKAAPRVIFNTILGDSALALIVALLSHVGVVSLITYALLGRSILVPLPLVAILVGALIAAILVAVWARQSALELINKRQNMPTTATKRLKEVNEIVRESVLAWTLPNDQRGRDEYRTARDELIAGGKIVVQQIVIIYHEQHFKEVLGMLAKFGKYENYELRYFEPTDPPLPAISLWSFDEKCTYMAAPYFPGTPAVDQTLAMYDQRANAWLNNYWSILWGQAPELSYSLVVVEDRLAAIAKRLGLEKEYPDLVEKYAKAAEKPCWENAELVRRA